MFDGRRHVPLIALPGMRERSVKIGSAGKIFSLTGWKVGFVCAAPPCCACSPRRTSSSPSRRRRTCRPRSPTGSARRTTISTACGATCSAAATASPAGLRALGFPVLEAQGTYFVNVDLAPLGLNEDDESFCKRLVVEHKVAAIPVSAFYAEDPISQWCASASPSATRRSMPRSNGWAGR